MYDVTTLATPEVMHWAAAPISNWRDYCARHGYPFTVYEEKLLEGFHINWSKVEILRRHMQQGSGDYAVFVDADSMVIRPERDLDWLVERYPGKDILVSEDVRRFYGIPVPLSLLGYRECGIRPLNTGFLLVRKSARSLALLEEWIELGRDSLAHIADIFPREQWVLWRGLFKRHRDMIGIVGEEVVRCGNNKLFDAILPRSDATFVLHDKRLKRDTAR